MNKVLIINASVRKERSHSRKLTQLFEKNWQKKHPNDVFTYREVGLEEIPPINEKWISSAFIKPSERTKENQSGVALSDALVKEFKAHDVYVLGTPMYNWSIPSGLKAYIDGSSSYLGIINRFEIKSPFYAIGQSKPSHTFVF
ncbi:FMN-dependent NADH-azoreductase [Flagellimonas aurea]|uniref:FMN-dependent NADH-azoreductase n=1 Tax=Flagellimonas aurea TaxID=2915619 RepID=UPI0035D10267